MRKAVVGIARFKFTKIPLPLSRPALLSIRLLETLTERVGERKRNPSIDWRSNGDQHRDDGCGLLRRSERDPGVDQLHPTTQSLEGRRGESFVDPLLFI